VENPWLQLPPEDPFVLHSDIESVRLYNHSRRTVETKINTGSIPEPFIGNPELAKLVLLNLNPGDSLGDSRAHSDPAFRDAMIRNLHRQPQAYSFYPLNPTFASSPCAGWWKPRTRELQRAAGLDDRMFADRLLVIEWCPYHSIKSGLPIGPICKSQKYSFELAQEMRRSGKLVVRMRSKRHWMAVDPAFGAVDALKNPQCGYISRGNTEGDLFERMVAALRDS
jgi:hypothetical protein